MDRPSNDPEWLAAVARTEARDGRVTVPHGGRERSFSLFSIAGFPCSGMDWAGRLLSLHPNVLVADPPRRLGPLGSGRAATREALGRSRDEAIRAALAAAWHKPHATHLGVIVVSGDAATFDPEIRVLRDGRDVLVAWTIRQLREEGEALRRFLKKPLKDQHGMENLMPEICQRFRADSADILDRNPGLLLADYDWVRYSAHLWDDQVTGYFGAMGAIADGKLRGSAPLEVSFEAARAAPLTVLEGAVGFLGLDPLPPGTIPPDGDPVAASETDPELLAEWEVGRWKRYFTPRASKLFKMDAWSALESVTGNYGDDEWEGECEP